ncbi:MAG: ATP-binding domain-containing protein, partial [Sinobacteraceae bacterium]|nr:ATP-binding domain-containing protein [Nevskiaceae bacterium]
FNKSMADEMKDRISKQGIRYLKASTLHSLAFQSQRREIGAQRLGKPLVARRIADELKYQGMTIPGLPDRITPVGAAWVALRSLTRYCQSGDTVMGKQHLSSGKYNILTQIRDAVRDALEPHSLALGEAAFDVGRGWPMPHEVYLKRYVEGVAEDAAMGPWGQYLIGDEFQDANGVTMKFMRSMRRAGRQIIVAGDPCQQIYQWRGSVNAMSRLETDVTLELTQSFRFGQPLADLASKILHLLGREVNMTGNPAIVTKLHDKAPAPPSQRSAIICRTNRGVVEAAMHHALRGGCHIAKAGPMLDVILDLDDLQHGKLGSRSELRIFRSVDAFREYMENGGDVYLPYLKLIRDYGVTHLVEVLEAARRNRRAATEIMTAHSSKGRQFPHVVLWSDFPDEEYIVKRGSLMEELRLLYVAATRAQHTLDFHRVPILRCIQEQRLPQGLRFSISAALRESSDAMFTVAKPKVETPVVISALRPCRVRECADCRALV